MMLALYVVVALVVTVGSLAGGTHVYHSWHYKRCLANIARLEIELGYREPPRRPSLATAQAAWLEGVTRGHKRNAYDRQRA